MAKMFGSDVRHASSTTMPPRSPTARPHAARQLVARPNASGEHDDVACRARCHPRTRADAARVSPAPMRLRVRAGVHLHAERFDLRAQQRAAAGVHLHGHQARRELDDVRFEAEVAQRLRGFEPEQAAADHGADLRLARSRRESLRDPRSCGRRGSPRDRVPAPAARTDTSPWRSPACRTAAPRLRRCARTCCSRSIASARSPSRSSMPCFAMKPGRHHRQIVRGLAGEERGELHAVVGSARLFAEHDDLEAAASASTSCSRKRCPTMPLPMTISLRLRIHRSTP